MPVETNFEQEFKFDVGPDFDPPDLRSLVGRTERLPAQHLTTVYFDTPDRRLWAHGITLRHRIEAEGDGASADGAPDAGAGDGGAGKWTLKLPEPATGPGGGPQGQARSELSWKGLRSEVPPDARAVVAGLVRRAPLEPVVSLATERRRLLLGGGGGDDGGQAWAEMDDDLVTVTAGGRKGLKFRQIEVELLAGRVPVVERVLGELRRAGAAPGGGSKFALAAGLDEYRPDRPHRPDRPDRDRAGGAARIGGGAGRGKAKGGLAEVVGTVLAADLARLLDWDYRLRIPDGSGDPAGLDGPAVRGAGAALRRLRSDLRTFGPVLDQVWVNHIRADLNWMAELVDRLRQEDAVVERVRGHAESPDREAVDELIRLLRSDRHLGATELCEALSSDRYADLVERLHTASLAPPLAAEAGHVRPGSLDRVLTSLVAARWRALRIGLDDLGPAPSDYDLDHVRVLAKRLRHAAEAVEPYVGRPARRTAHSAQALQNCLGALSDAVNASTVIRELASHPSVTPAVAYVAGHIAGRAEGEAGGARRSWPKRAKKLRRGPAAAWLA